MTFAEWLNSRARTAGLDPNSPELAGPLAVLASLAVTQGLTAEQAGGVARTLGTTSEEVHAAYALEWDRDYGQTVAELAALSPKEAADAADMFGLDAETRERIERLQRGR